MQQVDSAISVLSSKFRPIHPRLVFEYTP